MDQGVLTAIAAVIAALLGLWNAWKATKLGDKLDDTQDELKALRRPAPLRKGRRR